MNFKKTILVTGGAGFIGSTLLNHLVIKYPKYTFINIDSLTAVADLNNIEVAESQNYFFAQVDIRDRVSLEEIFKNHEVTDVMHLAAESHVDVSITNPNIFIETNLVGTGNLLSLALKYNINRFLHVSTDEVYGSLSLTDAPFTEASPLLPNSPYSASKAGSDCLVRAFNVTYGLDTIITRCSNNYGPRQDLSKFIPNAICKLLSDESIPVYGDGSNIRDWLFVDDHVTALDLLFHEGKSGEVYNIGGGTEKSNLEVAQMIAELAGLPNAIAFVEDRKGHDFRYAIEDKKIRELGYSPNTPFDTGIQTTFTWYRSKLS